MTSRTRAILRKADREIAQLAKFLAGHRRFLRGIWTSNHSRTVAS